MGAAAKEERNPRTTEFEFMGPYLGSYGILLGLPLLVWAASYYCNQNGWPVIPSALPMWDDIKGTWSNEVFLVYIAWFLFQVVLHLLVPGPDVDGVQLRNGSRLKYRINGWRCLLLTLVAAAAVHVYVTPLTWIADHFPQLATSMIAFSFLLSVYLYASSFVGDKMLALGGNSGIAIYDFFIGRELNPRVLGGRLDLKYFCELRPGLFGWLVINIAMALRQYETMGTVTPNMLLVLFFQGLYVADSVFCEECILTTMDIIQDGFGFMLAFGDLAWVPVMYSLQARYLADTSLQFPLWFTALAAGVAIVGFYIFRAANAQKDTFKKEPNHPSVKDLPYIKTENGGRLLAGGWWGTARHINYFGDWLLSVGMSLPTGFGTPVTYFYPVYFAVLLWHRELRDEHKCAHKYGKDWVKYKQMVPYRIIPYAY